jgi:cytochrome c-type biogenesis protein CcmE
MKPHRRNQLLLVGLLATMSALAVGLALTAFDESMNLFYDPAQIVAGEAPTDRTIRTGGMVIRPALKSPLVWGISPVRNTRLSTRGSCPTCFARDRV